MTVEQLPWFQKKYQEISIWLKNKISDNSWIDLFAFFNNYTQPVGDAAKNLYQLNLHFVGEIAGNEKLREIQVAGAKRVWAAHDNGVHIKDVTGQANAEQIAYKITLTTAHVIDCGDYDNDEIILNIDCAKLNCYLLAHELGHLFGFIHPKDSAADARFFGSIMEPRTPNLPHVSKEQLKQLNEFLRHETKKQPPNNKISAPVSGLSSQAFEPVELPQGYVPPFFIRSFHYDDGRPLDLKPHNFVSPARPNRQLLSLDIESDIDWFGWHADISNLWPGPPPVILIEPPRCQPNTLSGYKHVAPQNEQPNYLYFRLTVCDPNLDNHHPIRVFLYRADREGNQFKLKRVSGLTGAEIEDDAILFYPGGAGSLRKFVEWVPANWDPDNTWLVAIAWNYKMWFPDLPGFTSWVEQAVASPFLFQTLRNKYEEHFFHKLNTLSFDVNEVTFKEWLANNRCVAVRRPGNPCD